MINNRFARIFSFVFSFSVVAASLVCAQTKDYQPKLGQEGKDAVWEPTPQPLVDKMLDMAKVTPKDHLIDLGSGDGRLVIAAAKRGADAVGIEYNPDLVALSKRAAAKAGVSDKARFIQGDLFQVDLSKAEVISMFLLSTLNRRLRPRLFALKPGTRIVTNTFDLGDWAPDQSAKLPRCETWCTAHLWIVPAKIDGVWSTPEGQLTISQEFQIIRGQFKFGTAVGLIEGKLIADRFTFNAGGARYNGRVRGDTMEGVVGKTNWRATRASK
jgi:SAM-dependent methyltransferase